ncbi:hypothetical protein IFM89_021480 [Coptis chinensis]|uniref:Uncharacterized protein n=1 Tax=Coptis chinensis TaxID=261450 RepID=A0A835IPK2_9MAGN|nr:hypothetical protein IFM89_021480 [Coptis chinensis]
MQALLFFLSMLSLLVQSVCLKVGSCFCILKDGSSSRRGNEYIRDVSLLMSPDDYIFLYQIQPLMKTEETESGEMERISACQTLHSEAKYMAVLSYVVRLFYYLVVYV